MRTQIRLTILYSGLIILFLLLFIIIVYSLLYTIIFNREEQQIQRLADQELSVVIRYLREYGRMNPAYPGNQDMIVIGTDQFFYYVMDPAGRLRFGDEVVHLLRPDLINMLQGWTPRDHEVRYETLQINFSERLRIVFPPPPANPHEIRLIMTARPILIGDRFAGILYVGKNISGIYEMLQSLLVLLAALALAFSGVAIFLSHLMSRRAMIPIMQSYARQRQFTADASHELRTPLSVLLSSINALEMEKEIDDANDFSRKILANMKDEVKRITKLVEYLLILARSDSGQPDLLWETFDVRLHVEQILHNMEPLAKSKQIRLDLNAPNSLVVYGDSERLKQLIYILLDNAIKYTPEGGEVSVTLFMEDQERRPALAIQVKDTGIGISPEDQRQIFDRFYRVDKARSREMEGHGLGLSIAKWIVEAHGGTIQVSSKLGEGSTFKVKIPQQAPRPKRPSRQTV